MAESTCRDSGHRLSRLLGMPDIASVNDPRVGGCQYDAEQGRWSCWPRKVEQIQAPTEPDVTDRDLEIFRLAAEHFRHDLNAFWTSASFFILIEGALVAVFAQAIGSRETTQSEGLATSLQEAVFLASAGLFLSLFWGWASWRRRVLIQAWRNQVAHLDGVVDRHGVYLRIEQAVGTRKRFGPTAFTSTLPWFVAAGWTSSLLWLAAVAH